MKKTGRLPIIITSVLSALSLWFLAPTIFELKNPEKELPKWMAQTAMRLGLDLQGGIHLVLGTDLDKVVQTELNHLGSRLEKALKEKNINVTTKLLAKTLELEITAASPADEAQVASYIRAEFTALEYVGSSGNVGVTRLARPNESGLREQAMSQSITTLRNRIDEFGVAEPIISKLGEGQILVQFPGAKDPERLKGLIGQTAQLSFQMVHGCTREENGCLERQQADLETKIKTAEEKGPYTKESFKTFSEYRNRLNQDLAGQIPENTTVAFEKLVDTTVIGKQILKPYLLSTKDVLSGEYIKDARVDPNGGDGGLMQQPQPAVSFEMNPEGAPLFRELTGRSVGRYMAIVLDGVIKSAPVINSEISGSGQITLGRGNVEETLKEANDTAIVLRAGALPTSIEIQEERVIGPSIGAVAIEAGRNSLIVSTLVVVIFMVLYYGVGGIIASFATLINVAMIFAILGLLNATLTLPGIAGIILTIGMAVDAFIIIFERMRDEIRSGKTSRQVVELGFDQAVRTILDANITTAIGAYVLLEFGSGSIRGFALTLLVGISTNVFIATYFSKSIFDILVGSNRQRVSVGIEHNLTPQKA